MLVQRRVRDVLYMILIGLAVAAAVLALERSTGLFAVLRPHPQRVPTSGAPRSYDDALRSANADVEGAESVAKGRTDEWLIEERLAGAYIARARLTGSFDDYAAAQKALDQAFATTPPGVGPHLTQAMLAFTLHRLAKAGSMITAMEHYAIAPEAETRTELNAMRGDIAFYRGDYAVALRAYGGGQDAKETEGSFRLAVYQSKTGQTDKALTTIDRVEASARFPTAQLLSNLALMRGALELQRGNWDEATKHFEHADKLFPGYWLTQAHLAQMLALSGHRPEAIRRFQTIAQHSDSPEVMDALASLYRAAGDRKRSGIWADRAGAIWEKRLRLIPEAAYGHAVEHFLAFGDPHRALELATLDYQARPYGMSATALAWAYLANNQPADALRVIDPVLRSAWVSAEAHVAAAQAHVLLGESDAADSEQQAALAINPRATDPAAALIWFGH